MSRRHGRIPQLLTIERMMQQTTESGWKIRRLTRIFEWRMSFVSIGSDLLSQILLPSIETDDGDAGPCRARKIRQKIDGLTFIFDGTEFRKYTYALNGDDYRDRKKRQSAEKCIHHVVRGRKVSSEFHLKDSHSRRRRLVGSCFFRVICMKFHSGKSAGMDIDRKD